MVNIDFLLIEKLNGPSGPSAIIPAGVFQPALGSVTPLNEVY